MMSFDILSGTPEGLINQSSIHHIFEFNLKVPLILGFYRVIHYSTLLRGVQCIAEYGHIQYRAMQ